MKLGFYYFFSSFLSIAESLYYFLKYHHIFTIANHQQFYQNAPGTAIVTFKASIFSFHCYQTYIYKIERASTKSIYREVKKGAMNILKIRF